MDDHTFCETVQSEFAFLVHDQGFRPARVVRHGRTGPRHAAYVRNIFQHRSDRYVMVGAAIWRLEFDVDLGPGNYPKKEFEATLSELLELVAPNYEHPVPVPIGEARTDPEVMNRQIQACARALQDHGERLFRGDTHLWTELRVRREDRHREFMKHLEYDTTRRKALAAFKEGDWQLTASLYESMSDQLTAVERKRLSIARKRLA